MVKYTQRLALPLTPPVLVAVICTRYLPALRRWPLIVPVKLTLTAAA